jgi:hypothetical protein
MYELRLDASPSERSQSRKFRSGQLRLVGDVSLRHYVLASRSNAMLEGVRMDLCVDACWPAVQTLVIDESKYFALVLAISTSSRCKQFKRSSCPSARKPCLQSTINLYCKPECYEKVRRNRPLRIGDAQTYSNEECQSNFRRTMSQFGRIRQPGSVVAEEEHMRSRCHHLKDG